MEQVWFKGSSLRIKRKDRMEKKGKPLWKGPFVGSARSQDGVEAIVNTGRDMQWQGPITLLLR